MVSISFVKNHLWLRSGNSELLIVPEHIVALHKLQDKREFAQYFLCQALLNRPARKLFQSWARKDIELWQKLYVLIMGLKFESNTEQAVDQAVSQAGGEETTVASAEEVIEVEAETTAEGAVAEEITDASQDQQATTDQASEHKGSQ